MAIHIGCGSWADAAYVGVLYPKKSPAGQRLHVYSQWFDRVELNASYYRTPSAKQMQEWATQTPSGFVFDFKLHKNFSLHPSRATASDELARVAAAVDPLIRTDKLRAFLLTLPPSFGPASHSLHELDDLIGKLPPRPLAVELRHRGWVQETALASTLDYFRRNKLVWVALDMPKLDATSVLPPLDEVTNRALAYMRLHGRNPDYLEGKTAAEKHHYDYSERELEEIVARIKSLSTRAKDVHVSVNNHAEDFAPKAALTLRRLLGQSVKGVNLGNQETLFDE